MVRAGSSWRLMPHDLPPWYTAYQPTQRWIKAGVFEAMVHDLRELLRLLEGRNAQPSAVMFDSRTLQSSIESGNRAGDDSGKRKNGSKVPLAVDTLGHLLALVVTAANEQDRAQVERWLNRFKPSLENWWKLPLWIKPTLENNPPMLPKHRECAWKS